MTIARPTGCTLRAGFRSGAGVKPALTFRMKGSGFDAV